MRTIRRLYFYAVALISLEAVLWGLIGLARSIFHSSDVVGGVTDRLAQSLALILVGVPVFGFHWWKAQKDAAADEEEHTSGVRAVFLHAALLFTLIPIVQNFIALANRLLLDTVQMNTRMAFVGGAQSWGDNLVAMLMNALAAVYFFQVTRRDRDGLTRKENFIRVRRFYRYIWHFYGLILVVAGTQQTLRFVLDLIPGPFGSMMRASLVNGVTLLLVSAPVWFFAWKTIQEAPGDPDERGSLLRLGVLYFLSLAGVLTVLTAAGTVLDALLRLVFGQTLSLQEVINRINLPLAIGIPLGGVWAYYGRWLGAAIAGTADTTRRAGLRRIFHSVLALIGLAAAFTGLGLVLTFIIDRLVTGTAQMGTLTGGLAALICGLPLWLLTWRPLQSEALSEGDAGDHARRSLLRRSSLYLILFTSVVGGMISAVAMLFQLLRAVFGQAQANVADQVLRLAGWLLLFIGLGIYHGLTMRRDGKLAMAALGAKHAAFPVLLFDPGDGAFAVGLLTAIQKQAPLLPVTVQPADQPVPAALQPGAVVLPASLALDPPQALRDWLSAYPGQRIAVPSSTGRWIVTGAAAADYHQAALALRNLAEGHEVRPRAGSSGWMIVVYIAAGLFGVELLFSLLSMGLSFFID